MGSTVQTAPSAIHLDQPDDIFLIEDDAEREPRQWIDLRSIWAAIFRNRFVILAIFAIALLIGVIGVLLTTPIYQARASIQIDQQAARVLGTEEQEPMPIGTEVDRFLQTQIDILKSQSLAQRVSQSLGLATSDAFLEAMGADIDERLYSTSREEQVIEVLQENMGVNLPPNTRVIEITFSSRDPELAARVANSYVENFISGNIERRFSTTSYARNFLENQLEKARQRLQNSEQQLNEYARGARLIDTSGTSSEGGSTRSPTVANLMQLNQAYASAQAARTMAEQRWRQAQATNLMDLPQVLSNGTVMALAEQKAELTGTLASLSERLTADHPQVVQVNAQLAEIDRQMRAIASSVRASIRNEYETAARQENALQSQVQGLEADTYSEQDRGVRYNILRREVDTNRALYDSLLNRFREVSAAAGVVPNNVTPVDEAQVPRRPIHPNIKLFALAALLAAIALSVIAVFAREWFDDTIRSPDQFEDKLRLPLLGAVPLVRDGDPRTALREPHSPLSEAYHAIRASIELSSTSGIPHTLLITSSRKGEGKSTTALALAQDMAATGGKVVLVDADLRAPTLHRFVSTAGEDRPAGLSDLLVGRRTLDDVLHDGLEGGEAEGGTGRLKLLFSGPIPPDSATLLSGEALGTVIDQLRERFEIVILDAPPVMALADAIHLSAHSDGVLFVTEAGGAHFGQAKGALRRLQRASARLIGGVLTKYDARKAGYGEDYYGYDYGARADRGGT